NRQEFVSSIIIELVRLWPTIQIIHGRPRHSASQENFQESIYDLDDLIYDSLPVVESSVDLIQDTILIVESSSQNSSLDPNLDNLIDNHNNMPIDSSSQHSTSQPLQDLTNQPLTGHQELRRSAQQNLEVYTAKMVSAMVAKSK
ncbi:4892_t:CDS:2, partial [Dentiscutata heterogama]